MTVQAGVDRRREESTPPAGVDPTKDHAKWKPGGITWAVAFFALVALHAGLYPSAASWFTAKNQAAVVDGYGSQLANVHPSAEEQLRLAKRYNDALTAGVALPAMGNVPVGEGSSSEEHLDYWSILKANSMGLMARVRVPAANIEDRKSVV